MARLSPSPAEPLAQQPTPIPFIDLKAQQERIRPAIDRAIARVLDHGQYIMGPEIAEFECQLAAYCGVKHAITCASGTDALLMALLAKGAGPGQSVLCPAFTYTATPEAMVLVGATPVFVDVDAASFNMSVAGLEGGFAAARAAGMKPAGIIAVDLFGQPADYDAINGFAEAHGLWVIADSAQSFGAQYNGRRVGSLAEITATSFFPAKPLGCYGDGGALFTDNDALADVLRSIRLHGKGADKYDVVRLGINGRLDTLQAAILLEKLAIFPGEVENRQAAADRYTSALAGHIATPPVADGKRSVWAQYTVRIEASRREPVRAALKARGIPTEIYYPRPLHHQPAYKSFPVAERGVPVSEALAREAFSLPMHPYLTPGVQDTITAALLDVLK